MFILGQHGLLLVVLDNLPATTGYQTTSDLQEYFVKKSLLDCEKLSVMSGVHPMIDWLNMIEGVEVINGRRL